MLSNICQKSVRKLSENCQKTVRYKNMYDTLFGSFQLKSLRESNLQLIPADLKEYLKMLMSATPTLRPDAAQFAKIGYFDDIGVKTLGNLDTQFQWDNLQKSQFYKVRHAEMGKKKLVLGWVIPPPRRWGEFTQYT